MQLTFTINTPLIGSWIETPDYFFLLQCDRHYKYSLDRELDWNGTWDPAGGVEIAYKYSLDRELDWNAKIVDRDDPQKPYKYSLDRELDWNVDEYDPKFEFIIYKYSLDRELDWNIAAINPDNIIWSINTPLIGSWIETLLKKPSQRQARV